MEFDYVIVGGGSAGCVLAGRLSADPGTRVCLIEAGPGDDNVLCRVPFATALFIPGKWRNWAFATEPQAGLAGRRGYQPRGRMLGGSSGLNAMIYIRGHASDYDEWAVQGAQGWSFADVLAYFKRAEGNERFGGTLHGRDGPLNVADPVSPNPINDVFLKACDQLQLPRNEDFNGAVQEGVGLYQVTQKNGERWSAARAYLPPEARSRANLRIATGTRALRVALDGRRAVGVVCRSGKEEVSIPARRAVILSAGAFQSPQLLLLSGIGPPDELTRHGIERRARAAGCRAQPAGSPGFHASLPGAKPAPVRLHAAWPGAASIRDQALEARAQGPAHDQLCRVRRLHQDRPGVAAARHPVAFRDRARRRPRTQAPFHDRLQPAHVRAAAAEPRHRRAS